jgi:hypothetical protein
MDVSLDEGGQHQLARGVDGRPRGDGKIGANAADPAIRNGQVLPSPSDDPALDEEIVSATMAGRSWPSTSMTISLVRRTPLSATSSAFRNFWRSRMREPAGTGVTKRTLLDP